MDHYDVVIERTVRDLFRYSPLPLIKKFKFNKEKEIIKIEEELRNLILVKYPILIKSIYSLEEISNSLDHLQDIRKKIGENVNQTENDLNNENVYKFRTDLFNQDENNNNYNINIQIDENMYEDLDECWKIINNPYNTQNDFDILLLTLIRIKNKIVNENNSGKFFKENFDFILVDFMELLMKNFISKKLYSLDDNQLKLEKYFIYFYGIYFLIFKKEKLNFSEFYNKLNNDENVNKYIEIIFNDKNEYNINNYSESLYLIFKLILLKLSKSFNFLNSISNGNNNNFINKHADFNFTLENNIVDIYMNTFYVINVIYNIYNKSELNNENEDDFYNSHEENNNNNNNDNIFQFNFKNILKQIKLIFSTNLKNFDEQNLINNNKETIKRFLSFIKDKFNKNFTTNSGMKFNNDYTRVFSFWQNSFIYIKNLLNLTIDKKLFNILNKVIKSLENKLDNLDNNTNNKDNNNVEILFDFIFIDKSVNQIKSIITDEFNNLEIENFTNLNSKIYPQINQLISKIYNYNNNVDVDGKIIYRNFIYKIILILQTETFKFSERCLNKITKNLNSSLNNNDNNDSYINFIVNLFCDKKFKFYITELNFTNSIENINKIAKLFLKNKFSIINNYMKKIKKFLELENYIDDDYYNKNEKSDSLDELYNFLNFNFNFDLLEFEDINKEEIKIKILDIIINNYLDEIEYLKVENIFNVKIWNDIKVFRKLLEDFNYREEMKILIEKIENLLKNSNIYNNDEISKNLEENAFYLFFTEKVIKKNFKDNNKNNHIQFSKFKMNNNNSDYIIKEIISFHPRMNNFMIKKTEINKTTKSSTYQSFEAQINSTSKLLDLRIDENYLSLKSQKTETNSYKSSNSASFNEITGINKNIITQVDNKNLKGINTVKNNSSINHPLNINKNCSTIKTFSSSDRTDKTDRSVKTYRNERESTNNINPDLNITQPNLKNVLGYFGGMLKDNLSNFTGYINTNTNLNLGNTTNQSNTNN